METFTRHLQSALLNKLLAGLAPTCTAPVQRRSAYDLGQQARRSAKTNVWPAGDGAPWTGVVPGLLAALRDTERDRAMQVLVIDCLIILCQHPELRARMFALDTPTLLTSLLAPTQPTNVQFAAASFVRKLAHYVADATTAAQMHVTVAPLLALLAPDAHPLVQVQASAALWNLSIRHVDTHILTTPAALRAILAVLKAATTADGLQVMAALLRCIASFHTSARPVLAELGAVEALVPLLRHESIQVQQQAAGALGNVTYREPANRDRLREAGAIPPLVALLASRSLDVQLMAATVLRNLALDDDSRVAMVRVGGLESLAALLAAPAAPIVEQAAAALWNLALNPQVRAHLLTDPGNVPRSLKTLLRTRIPRITHFVRGTLAALGIVDPV